MPTMETMPARPMLEKPKKTMRTPVNTPGSNHSMDVQANTRGQIHVTLRLSDKVLTVGVGQARLLKSKWKDQCDSYVQVILCPDETRTTIQESEIQFNTNSPTFDQTFTYNCCEEEKKKRLMIIIWHRDTQKKCSEFLGCLSFGLRHLASKSQGAQGWYHLLSEDLGYRKHIAVATTALSVSSCKSTGSKSEGSANMLEIGEKIEKETKTVLLKRGSHGYGFTVRGSCPVCVGHVKDTGSAHGAGLQRGDWVVKLNGVNVLSETADKVAAIIRTSVKQVVIDLYKPQTGSRSFASLPQSHLMCSPISLPTDSCNLDDAIMDNSNEENQSSWRPVTPMFSDFEGSVFSRKHLLSQTSSDQSSLASFHRVHSPLPKISPCNTFTSDRQLRTDSLGSLGAAAPSPRKTPLNERIVEGGNSPKRLKVSQTPTKKKDVTVTPKKSASKLPWIPDISIVERVNSFSGHFFSSSLSLDGASLCANDCGELYQDTREPTVVTDSSSVHGSEGDECSVFSDESCRLMLGASATDVGRTTLMKASLLGTSLARETLVQQVLECEARYVQTMHQSIQRYSRPLRYCVLSASDHACLFQNIEKLVAISEFCIYQLMKDNEQEEERPDGIGWIYKTKVGMLCTAYETYSTGLPQAHYLLEELTAFPELAAYLQKLQSADLGMTLAEFLNHPIQHLYKLLHLFKDVLDHSTVKDSDYMDLKAVVDALEKTCRAMCKPPRRRPHRDGSLCSDMSHASSGGVSSGSATTTSSLGESELDRLVNPNTGKQPLEKKGRHLVFSGELLSTSSGHCDPLKVMLLTDQLLVAMETKEGRLSLVEDPIALSDILELDFCCHHPSEFSLKLGSRLDHSGLRHLALRALSIEEKSTWKVLLQQRIQICRNQRTPAHRSQLSMELERA